MVKARSDSSAHDISGQRAAAVEAQLAATSIARSTARHPALPERVERMAVMRALHVGDLLIATPGLRALRAGFPKAEITFIGLAWARAFIQRYPYADRFMEFPGYPGIPEVPVDRARMEAFVEEARAYRYDLAIQIHGNGLIGNRFILGMGARCTAGYFPLGSDDRRPTITLPYPDDRNEVLRVLGLVQALGVPAESTRTEFPVLPEDRTRLSALLERNGVGPGVRLVGINPSARAPARRWLPERFAKVADALRERLSAMIVLTGGPGEGEVAERVRALMRGPALSLAGQTGLGELAALMERCLAFVTNDSGPGHLATAVDAPSVIVFGPADVRRWAPLDRRRHAVIHHPVECSPCLYWDCPIDHRCLTRIHAPEVVEAAMRVVGEGL